MVRAWQALFGTRFLISTLEIWDQDIIVDDESTYPSALATALSFEHLESSADPTTLFPQSSFAHL
jgi:hypothetical protein